MNKVVITIPYFGNLPHFFPIYLKGCWYNESIIDVLFLSDCEKPKQLPQNVKWIPFSIQQFYDRVALVTGVKVFHTDTHKVCDLKPFYGLMFADYIKSYDFWGYGDIDLIYGNLGMIFNHDFYEKYDAFTAHSVQAAGHFTVLRNSSKINNLCFNIENYQQRISSTIFTTFMDEWDMGLILSKRSEIQVLRPRLLDEELLCGKTLHNITYKHDANIAYTASKTTLTKWENGRCYYYYKGKFVEAPYIHFMGLKHAYFWKKYDCFYQ